MRTWHKLLANKAGVNAKGSGAATPCTWQRKRGQGCSRTAAGQGDRVNAKANDGAIPLHSAAANGHAELAELLLAKGADVECQGQRQGATPLHSAAGNGHPEVRNCSWPRGPR